MASAQAVNQKQIVEAQTNAAASFPTSADDIDHLTSFVIGTLEPLPEDVTDTLLGNHEVAAALSNAEIIALSHFQLAYRANYVDADGVLGGALWLDGLGDDPEAFAYRVGFIDPTAVGDGFDELRVRVVIDGDITVIDETFTDTADAIDFLDGLVINTDPTTDLHVEFDMTMSDADHGFSVGVIVALIPEPSSALMLALGLIGLAFMGRRQ